VKHDFTPQAITAIMIEPLTVPALRPPSGMYNGMIAPLLPFAIRGAIWYQGEGNAGRAYQYRKLLPAMIRSWRNAWGEGDFPFLIVQLPNYRERRDQPSESDWAELREAQAMTAASVPHAGMSVNIDLGEAGDVHPREKREVGARLARYALGSIYGMEQVYSGPVYESMRIDGARVRLRFNQMGSGLTARDGDKLRGFAIAGADKKFVWADAAVEGGEVIVSSPAVPKPVAVRYAWADNPDANLANREGLLASPFRTDDWPGITEGKK
jgi:sialate O-acetylesterase